MLKNEYKINNEQLTLIRKIVLSKKLNNTASLIPERNNAKLNPADAISNNPVPDFASSIISSFDRGVKKKISAPQPFNELKSDQSSNEYLQLNNNQIKLSKPKTLGLLKKNKDFLNPKLADRDCEITDAYNKKSFNEYLRSSKIQRSSGSSDALTIRGSSDGASRMSARSFHLVQSKLFLHKNYNTNDVKTLNSVRLPLAVTSADKASSYLNPWINNYPPLSKANRQTSNYAGAENLKFNQNPALSGTKYKNQTSYSKMSEINLITISLASANRIRQWAEKILPNGKVIGEVINPETVHYKTLKPIKGGLFCERIFGPLKDHECACGKKFNIKNYLNNNPTSATSFQSLQSTNELKINSPGLKRYFCRICDVEYTYSLIRRTQLGYIQLASPTTHVWFVKGMPSYISILLDMKKKHLQNVIYNSAILTLEHSIKGQRHLPTTPKSIFESWQKIMKQQYPEKYAEKNQSLAEINKSNDKQSEPLTSDFKKRVALAGAPASAKSKDNLFIPVSRMLDPTARKGIKKSEADERKNNLSTFQNIIKNPIKKLNNFKTSNRRSRRIKYAQDSGTPVNGTQTQYLGSENLLLLANNPQSNNSKIFTQSSAISSLNQACEMDSKSLRSSKDSLNHFVKIKFASFNIKIFKKNNLKLYKQNKKKYYHNIFINLPLFNFADKTIFDRAKRDTKSEVRQPLTSIFDQVAHDRDRACEMILKQKAYFQIYKFILLPLQINNNKKTKKGFTSANEYQTNQSSKTINLRNNSSEFRLAQSISSFSKRNFGWFLLFKNFKSLTRIGNYSDIFEESLLHSDNTTLTVDFLNPKSEDRACEMIEERQQVTQVRNNSTFLPSDANVKSKQLRSQLKIKNYYKFVQNERELFINFFIKNLLFEKTKLYTLKNVSILTSSFILSLLNFCFKHAYLNSSNTLLNYKHTILNSLKLNCKQLPMPLYLLNLAKDHISLLSFDTPSAELSSSTASIKSYINTEPLLNSKISSSSKLYPDKLLKWYLNHTHYSIYLFKLNKIQRVKYLQYFISNLCQNIKLLSFAQPASEYLSIVFDDYISFVDGSSDSLTTRGAPASGTRSFHFVQSSRTSARSKKATEVVSRSNFRSVDFRSEVPNVRLKQSSSTQLFIYLAKYCVDQNAVNIMADNNQVFQRENYGLETISDAKAINIVDQKRLKRNVLFSKKEKFLFKLKKILNSYHLAKEKITKYTTKLAFLLLLNLTDRVRVPLDNLLFELEAGAPRKTSYRVSLADAPLTSIVDRASEMIEVQNNFLNPKLEVRQPLTSIFDQVAHDRALMRDAPSEDPLVVRESNALHTPKEDDRALVQDALSEDPLVVRESNALHTPKEDDRYNKLSNKQVYHNSLKNMVVNFKFNLLFEKKLKIKVVKRLYSLYLFKFYKLTYMFNYNTFKPINFICNRSPRLSFLLALSRTSIVFHSLARLNTVDVKNMIKNKSLVIKNLTKHFFNSQNTTRVNAQIRLSNKSLELHKIWKSCALKIGNSNLSRVDNFYSTNYEQKLFRFLSTTETHLKESLFVIRFTHSLNYSKDKKILTLWFFFLKDKLKLLVLNLYQTIMREFKKIKNPYFMPLFSLKSFLNWQSNIILMSYFKAESYLTGHYRFISTNTKSINGQFFVPLVSPSSVSAISYLDTPIAGALASPILDLSEDKSVYSIENRDNLNFNAIDSRNLITNNIYCLSHRELWEHEKDWQDFAYYYYSQPNLTDKPIPLYKHRNYDRACQDISTNFAYNNDNNSFQSYTHLITNGMNINTAFSGAGLIQKLLNEYNYSELKKIDKQNRILLFEYNKHIKTLKKIMLTTRHNLSAANVKSKNTKINKKEKQTNSIVKNKTIYYKAFHIRDVLIRRTKLTRKIFNNILISQKLERPRISDSINLEKNEHLPLTNINKSNPIDTSLSGNRGARASGTQTKSLDTAQAGQQAYETNGLNMVLTLLPVLPPVLRPVLKLSGQFTISDLNRLYQRIIYRNERLKKFLNDPALSSSFEMKYAQRLLQEAVDNLIQNGKSGVVPEKDNRGRLLKSLSDILKGKQGRFRQYLLGKRVDYSGRSVIVVGPRLKLHECGIPKEMALTLYSPFLIKRILNDKLADTYLSAKKLILTNPLLVSQLLREIMRTCPVLLNRAPTLHRLGFQAFQPKLVDGKAILLHPLVCPAFNADFDGDQMAVHVPITFEARAEAWKLMLARNNLLSPATGEPIILPSQDMVLGCYYLTTNCAEKWSKFKKGSALYFHSITDVMKAYTQGLLHIHAVIWVNIFAQIESGNVLEQPLEIRLPLNKALLNKQLFHKFNHSSNRNLNNNNNTISFLNQSLDTASADYDLSLLSGQKNLVQNVRTTNESYFASLLLAQNRNINSVPLAGAPLTSYLASLDQNNLTSSLNFSIEKFNTYLEIYSKSHNIMNPNGRVMNQIIRTTPGKIVFNIIIKNAIEKRPVLLSKYLTRKA